MENRVTTLLNIKYPIISAAMTWVTSAEFVAAASNAGGLGVLGPNVGQNETSSTPLENAENLRKEIRKVKQLTDNPFAVNYIFPMEVQVKIRLLVLYMMSLSKKKLNCVVAIGQGVVQHEVERLKEQNITIIYRDLNPTVGKLIKAEKSGVDALIVTSYEAGGHMSEFKISTLSLVPQVTKKVSLPIIAAGGIIDGIGAKAVFDMGAEAICMGTLFIATTENPASISAKKAILSAKRENFIEFKSGTSHLRTLPTEAGKKALELINLGKADEAYPYYKNGFKLGY